MTVSKAVDENITLAQCATAISKEILDHHFFDMYPESRKRWFSLIMNSVLRARDGESGTVPVTSVLPSIQLALNKLARVEDVEIASLTPTILHIDRVLSEATKSDKLTYDVLLQAVIGISILISPSETLPVLRRGRRLKKASFE